MRLRIVLLRQDDPKKCTATKLVRLGFASQTNRAPRTRAAVVLNPYSESYLIGSDASSIRSITAIDCSWRLAAEEFESVAGGRHKRLPPLLAGNPVNYSKMHKLTTVEAIAGSLFILGHDEQARSLLEKFSWGHTFYDLNSGLLAEYARLSSAAEIPRVLAEYGLADPSFMQ